MVSNSTIFHVPKKRKYETETERNTAGRILRIFYLTFDFFRGAPPVICSALRFVLLWSFSILPRLNRSKPNFWASPLVL